MSIADWNAGIIRPVAVAPTGPYQNGAAPGVWTLDQVAYWTKQGLWPTAGSQDPANIFIENLFSTYLYTGNGASQTITNNIDLAGKGGLVWNKDRNNANGHILVDSAVGLTKYRKTESTAADSTTTAWIFNNNGYVIPAPFGNVDNQVSWTFRKQPKFFDVVTWTGTGGARTLSHNLGSTPGCIIVKRTNDVGDWHVYHQSLGATKGVFLNTTAAATTDSGYWNDTAPTATQFTAGENINVGGGSNTYVAYLFAHDAGGFGLSGNENVVSCGSFTADGAGKATVNLGYEPQWLMYKRTDSSASGNWFIVDVMRGFDQSGIDYLNPNLSSAETPTGSGTLPNATGFNFAGAFNGTYIYIAIRRGPMAVPTLATTVFNSVARTGTGGTATVEPGFVTDLIIDQRRSAGGDGGVAWDRLRGAERYLFTRTTAAQGTTSNSLTSFANMNGVTVGADSGQVINVSGVPWINWMFRRAPGFMDVVCYTGNGTMQVLNHNLGVFPQLVILKSRSSSANWPVVYTNESYSEYYILGLNSTSASFFTTVGGQGLGIDSSTFRVTDAFGSFAASSAAGQTYVAYLFASAPGVSKVGSYTGTGTTQAIACGFTAGARFVLIKRTDSTGNWYIWDSARGITAGNDPYLWLNSLDAEVTGTDYINTSAAGFSITSTAPAEINANGGSYIFLAVA